MKKYWQWVILGCLILAVAGTILIKLASDKSSGEDIYVRPSAEVQVQPSEKPIEGLPTLIDLGAGTCVPCKMMAPILAELQRSYQGKVNVIVIDVNENREAATKYRIYAIPTQIFFDASGKELYRHEGFFAKEEIIARFVELGMVK